eukprot:8848272-Heterocapsa_arctica.AAC.1
METRFRAPAGGHPGRAGVVGGAVPAPWRRHGRVLLKSGAMVRWKGKGEEMAGPSLAARPEG